MRCEAADDVSRDVFLHGRWHMRLRISLKGCPADAVGVRWESMVRDGANFGLRLVVYDLAVSCAKWHVDRQRLRGARGAPSCPVVYCVLGELWASLCSSKVFTRVTSRGVEG